MPQIPKFYNLGMRQGRMPPLQMPRMHTGPITGGTLGRADARPMKVAAGSYVIPSSVVSHLGQGNTLGGNRVLDTMFKSGPYGTAQAKQLPRGGGMGIPRPLTPKFRADGGGLGPLTQAAQPEPVPIYAADGEYVLAPEQVTMIGDGDMKRGHAILDDFVKQQLADAASTTRKLPGPRQ